MNEVQSKRIIGLDMHPDVFAAAALVGSDATQARMEWVQDRQGYFWPEADVNERLKHILVSAFNDMVQHGEKHNVNNRIAAYMLAIDRVAYTIRQRGIYA